jgi:hypothetical protein
MSGMMDVAMMGAMMIGGYLLYRECLAPGKEGTCFGGQQPPPDDIDTGGIIIDPGPGNTGCPKNYKPCTAPNTGKCCCNRIVKGCGGNQIALLDGAGNCVCATCKPGYVRSGSDGNKCTLPTTAKQCPGRSGNCSWDCKNAYCWECLPPYCGVKIKKVCVVGPAPTTSGNRINGCNLAKNQYVKRNNAASNECKSCCSCRGGACKNLTGGTCTGCCNAGQPTCIKAAKGTGCASGYCCGNDGNCNWAANTNFGGYKTWTGRCSGSFGSISRGCCGYAVNQLKKKYGLISSYTQTQTQSFATTARGVPMGRRRAVVSRPRLVSRRMVA